MEEKRRKRVGILGGTFDPIHVGHLILAQTCYEQLGLDRMVFMPAGRPPHKLHRVGGATDEQRVEMVRLAIEGNEAFSVELMEIVQDRLSYSYVTLGALRAANPDTDYVFLMGEDSLRDFPTWRKPEEIARLSSIAVFRRGNSDEVALRELMEEFSKRYGTEFLLLEAEPVGVSSSRIRGLLRSGRSARYYVPEKVYEYICANGLYAHGEGGDGFAGI